MVDRIFRNSRIFGIRPLVKRKILSETKRKKDIIFGGRSIQKRIGIFSRPTEDYDIFTNKPKRSAKVMQRKLDNIAGFNYYYAKKGQHKGTHKVMGRGADQRKGTRDDEGVIDYSRTPRPRPRSTKIGGVKYRIITEEVRAKKKAIKDPAFKFRKKKDQEDLHRIRNERTFRRFRW